MCEFFVINWIEQKDLDSALTTRSPLNIIKKNSQTTGSNPTPLLKKPPTSNGAANDPARSPTELTQLI